MEDGILEHSEKQVMKGGTYMATIEQTFARLEKSDFRRKIHLSLKDKVYVTERGMDTIREHAVGFVCTRLAPANIPNDGKQTLTKFNCVVRINDV